MDVTPAQIGLAWLLAHAPNILLIPAPPIPRTSPRTWRSGQSRSTADTLAALEA